MWRKKSNSMKHTEDAAIEIISYLYHNDELLLFESLIGFYHIILCPILRSEIYRCVIHVFLKLVEKIIIIQYKEEFNYIHLCIC